MRKLFMKLKSEDKTILLVSNTREGIQLLYEQVLEMDAIIKKMKIQINKMQFIFIEGKKQIYIDKIRYVESQKHKLIFKIFGSTLKELFKQMVYTF